MLLSSSLQRLNVSCLFVKVIGLFAPSLLLDISVFRLFALPLLRIGFFAALRPLSTFFLSLLQGTDRALAQKLVEMMEVGSSLISVQVAPTSGQVALCYLSNISVISR